MKLPDEAVDAIRWARVALSNAHSNTSNWPSCGNSLAAACELAVRAISVAWGDPRASMARLTEFLNYPLGLELEASDIAVVEALWQYRAAEVRRKPHEAEALIQVAEAIVEKLVQLATQAPPSAWIPPSYNKVSWDSLSDRDKSFLTEVHNMAVRLAGPEVLTYLHGSRAKGSAREGSDYDVYMVFPDSTDRIICGLIMTSIPEVAARYDYSSCGAYDFSGEWHEPRRYRAPLIEEVKKYGIQVPSQDMS